MNTAATSLDRRPRIGRAGAGTGQRAARQAAYKHEHQPQHLYVTHERLEGCLTDRASAAATSLFVHYLTFLKHEASASCMRLLDGTFTGESLTVGVLGLGAHIPQTFIERVGVGP
jgi:hypothetical protein